MKGEFPLLTRDFGFLVSAHFLQALGYASMLLLPLYLEHLGASNAQIGLVMASASVGGLALRPLVGWALDALGRKPTILTGTFVLVCAQCSFLLVHDLGPMMFVARIFVGIGAGALFAGYFTFAADIIPKERRTEGLALFGVSGLIPLLVNPFVGQLGVQGAELRLVFPLVGLAIAISIPLLLLVPEPKAQVGEREEETGGVISVLRRREIWSIWFASLIFSGLVAIFMAFATVTAERRGLLQPQNLWLTYALGAVAVRLVGGRLPDRIGPARLIPPAMFCYALACALIAGAASPRSFLVAGLLAGVGHGYCFPILTSQLVGRVPAKFRGSALSTFTAIWEVTALTFTPVFGLVGDLWSDAALFGLAAVVAGGAVLVWLPLERAAIRVEMSREPG